MGTRGTGLLDNETASRVKERFEELLNDDVTVHEATKMILDDYHKQYDEQEDLEVLSQVYFGLAAGQLEEDKLLEEIRTRAIELIDRGADLNHWEQDEEDYPRREEVLLGFKEKLLAKGKAF
ncbi:MarR family transcriptional regulator [Fictibacillus fluitans]|uniref:MarR family transcriptional regulator n=1 Tax=Fictibacillus fluitans TaxID=3058422 RepID=A0ABT8HVK1_9BACL|nr:MarR family transcriptional regulator [Fictibacillus sp. NE201]MDN4524540.1 MarR family transcriptional regulator [Fictibacillus sp. NE201]